MRISIVAGFLLPIPPVQGGAMEKTWHRFAEEFVRAGHTVTFFSRRWPGWANDETIAGVRHVRLPGADHTRYLWLNLLLDFIWGLRVTRALPAADIVITNTVALPVWLRRVKPAAGRVVAAIARMPKGQIRFYGRVDLLLSLSPAVTARIIAEHPTMAARIAPFPLPIDWTALAAASRQLQSSTASRALTIGYIGRLHPEKGLELLLSAAARLLTRDDLPPWRLRLVGPLAIPSGGGGEPWLDGVRSRLSPALVQRLEILPPEFDRAKLALHYGALDIFCYPSLAEQGETFGVAVAEAMAAGAAPVVSGLACFHDLVRDRDTGLVFDHAAPDAASRLADTLTRLLLDPTLRHALAARAQAHVRRFDFPAGARAVLALLAPLATDK